MIRLVIADRHLLMREGLQCIFREVPTLAVVSEAGNGHDVLALARAGGFDVLLLELDLPGRSGLDLLRQLKSETPDLHMLVLSGLDADRYAIPAMRAGARGFVHKSASVAALIAAIHRVASGRIYTDDAVAARLVQHPVQPPPGLAHHTLSEREYAVFAAVVMGCSANAIALDMGISVKTVGTYKARLMEKLGVATLSDLVCYAIEQHLLASPEG